MRPSSGSGYSHIRVITKHLPERDNTGEKAASPPTFKNPSLAQEAEAALELPLANLSTNSPESLAKNLQGATFAAKARAAELQAARARRAMKTQNSSGLANPPVTPHETMTFKSKSKSSRTWKRIDLSDLPGPSKGDGTNQGYPDSDLGANIEAVQPDSAGYFRGKRGMGKEANIYQGTASSTSDSRTPPSSLKLTDAIKNSPHLSYSMTKGLSPATEALVKPFDDDDLGDWSPKQRSSVPKHELHKFNRAEDYHGVIETTSAFSATPVSTYTGSAESPSDADYESNMPMQQLFRRQVPAQDHPSLMPSFEIMSGSRRTDTEYQFNRSQDPMAGHFFTGEFENSRREDSMIKDRGFQTWNDYEEPSYIATLPLKPPHQYPAVKGTMSKNFQFPVTEVPQQRFGIHTSSINSSAQQNQDYQPNPENLQSLFPPPSAAINIPARKTSGSAFTEASKSFLLQKLHNVAESANKVENPSSRSVMHDPYAPVDQFHANVQSQFSSFSETSLCERSDALPWKERPVEILTRPSTTNCDYPILFGHVMRPDGCFPVKERKNERQKELDEADAWWASDNRFNKHGADVALLMGHVRNEEQKCKEQMLSDHAALRRANFPDDKRDALTRISEEKERANANALGLLAPVLANLASYSARNDYFHKFGEAPEWCRDHSLRGNQSFFGEDWGAPPPRLGRDPRYRPFQHEGRGPSHNDGVSYMYPDARNNAMHADTCSGGNGGAMRSDTRDSLGDTPSPTTGRGYTAALEWQNQDYVRWKA